MDCLLAREGNVNFNLRRAKHGNDTPIDWCLSADSLSLNPDRIAYTAREMKRKIMSKLHKIV